MWIIGGHLVVSGIFGRAFTDLAHPFSAAQILPISCDFVPFTNGVKNKVVYIPGTITAVSEAPHAANTVGCQTHESTMLISYFEIYLNFHLHLKLPE